MCRHTLVEGSVNAAQSCDDWALNTHMSCVDYKQIVFLILDELHKTVASGQWLAAGQNDSLLDISMLVRMMAPFLFAHGLF